MLRALLLTLVLMPFAARAVETVRIDMGSQPEEVTLKAEGLAFGQDVEDGAFKPLDGSVVKVRRVGDRLLLGEAPVVGESVRFHSQSSAGIDTGALKVRG